MAPAYDTGLGGNKFPVVLVPQPAGLGRDGIMFEILRLCRGEGRICGECIRCPTTCVVENLHKGYIQRAGSDADRRQ